MPEAQAKHLKDYTAPIFTINHIDLNVILDGENTKVIALSKVTRCHSHQLDLILDGEQLNLVSVKLNGKGCDYRQTDSQLIISTTESDFELEIITALNPEANTSLEGLYMSDGAYCTQCEAEGFRRITYFLDRPDV